MATENTEVQINNMNTTMRVVDGDILLTPRIMDAILQALNDRQAHEMRVRAETRITGGVVDEMDQEER